MKLDPTLLARALAAVALLVTPACDDKKEDSKTGGKAADKGGDKGGDAAGDKGGDKPDPAAAEGGKAGDGAKAEGGAAADGAKAEGGAAAGGDAGAADGGGEGGDAAARKLGVPVCDEYIDKYSKCIEENLAEPSKETSRKALNTQIEAWAKLASSAEHHEGLAQACKTSMDAVKVSCGW